MTKPKTIILMGPTASGKTGMAVKLAKRIGGEIISADSRQVFRGMDIGTGKDLPEYESIPYHLIDVVDAGTEFSVSDFQRLARQALQWIVQQHHTPIICGGTGHYIKALLEDYRFDDQKSDLRLTRQLEALPVTALYRQLKALGLWDSHHWTQDSKRRMARAIEKRLTQREPQARPPSFAARYRYRCYFIEMDRSLLRKKIRDRLSQRLDEGMVEEAETLLKNGITHARLERYGLEYKYLSLLIRGELTRDQLIEKLSVEISRFAKRQMTFIRYLQRNGHLMIPVHSFDELWNNVSAWMNDDETGGRKV